MSLDYLTRVFALRVALAHLEKFLLPLAKSDDS
jgi:hypothetical protein